MKNKIVKALVLASIVSMTATGAAGLTFADDDVVTGDTTSTSSETTTTTAKVDDIAEALTTAETDAKTKDTTFTKAYEDYEKAAKALEDVTTGLDTSLTKKRAAARKALDKLRVDEHSTDTAAQKLETEIRNGETVEYRIARELLQDVRTKFNSYSMARFYYMEALQIDVSGLQGAPADPKKEYEDALKAYKDALTAATSNETIKSAKAFEDLEEALAAEEADRTAFENALAEVVKLEEEAAKYAEGTDARKKLVEAEKEAKKALQVATKSYKEALGKVKTAAEAYTKATKGLVPVFRVFHPGTLEHLYTTGAHERDVLVEKGWKDEKVAWLTVDKDAEGATPVYRLCYPGTGDHFYTTDKYERDTIIKTQGWKDEQVAFYVPKKGDASVYRVYLSSLATGAHHYTTGRNEYDTLVKGGWRPEGEAYQVVAKDWIDVSAVKTTDERIEKAEKLAPEDNP